MSARETHPTWISPTPTQVETILGDCLASPILTVRAVASPNTLDGPSLVAEGRCANFTEGFVIDVAFPLSDVADTNAEQTQLGVDTVQVALDNLCSRCALRSCIG